MITLNTHNILDYVIGLTLILCPWAFAFNDVAAATNIFLLLGAGLNIYSLFTNYEYSIAHVIPLGTHMGLDALAGLLLIFSPVLFSYRGLRTPMQEILHYILGVGAIALVAFTRPRTEHERELTATIGSPSRVSLHRS